MTARDSLKQVRADLPGIIDERLSPIAASLARLEAAINTEQESQIRPWHEVFNLPENDWDNTPSTVQALMIEEYEGTDNDEDGTLQSYATADAVGQQVRKRKVVKGSGPYQPIIYNLQGVRMSTGLEAKIKQINRLISNGKAIKGARVPMTKYFQKIWRRELAPKNRFLWDTPSNVAKAIAKTKAGTVTGADSWNSTSRKRQFYRKPDNLDGTNAGKFDGLVLEMYQPPTGDGWIRVVEYTNPIRT